MSFHLARVFGISNPSNSEGVPFVLERFEVMAERPDEFFGVRTQEMPASEAVVLIE